MSTKVKRKVTVENSKEGSDQPRRPSVFERLGPGAVNVASQSQDRSSRIDRNEKCHNWLRGTCNFGINCRYQHGSFPNTSRRPKNEKDIDEKDLRHKMKNKHNETKESKTGSISPKRKEKKRSRSRSRKGEHENKIKSTVVVTRPRSPTAQPEPSEKEKKKTEGSWEDDSDDWPMDASQLDYKEELTLERKRQQLQRELEIELQKEQMLSENQRSVSESSSSSSSSDSGSISSSSDSTSSSSDEDSDDSSSSSSSTSSRSSASQIPTKKLKKIQIKKEPSHDTSHKKPLDDYDKIKNSRALKSTWRPRSSSPDVSIKKSRERKNASPNFSPKRRGHDSTSKTLSSQTGRKGPRTPSPTPIASKQRQWGQSSSADSRSADTRRSRTKRHKKKKDGSRANRNKMEYAPTPPPLSSPNRTVLQPHFGKNSRSKDDSGLRGRHKDHEQSPLLLSRVASQSNSPSRHGSHYSEVERYSDKQNPPKSYNRKLEDTRSAKSHSSKDRSSKYSRTSSPLSKDLRHLSVSPLRDKYDNDSLSKGMYSPPLSHIDKDEKRRGSLSPIRRNKDSKGRKTQNESEKRRENKDFSPRSHDNRRDNQYRNNDLYRKEDKESKKFKEEKGKDRILKDRNLDRDNWSEDSKKSIRNSDSRRLNEPILSQSGRDRPRDRDRDRKKGKDRELPLRTADDVERDRQRLSPSLSRVPPDLHHTLRDDVSRGRIYDSEIPSDSRDYGYAYVPHRETVYLDEPALAPDYESDLRVPPLYPPDPVDYPPSNYSESRYRRETTLKAVAPVPHIERIGGYGTRDLSPLGPRDPVPLAVHDDVDYLADLPIDDRRSYDERWSRTRPVRDEWDSYIPLPSSSLAPHVTAGLNEDRYGMPRRRHASPDWMSRRNDERELPLSREPRSRSPPHRRDDLTSGRGNWGDHTDRHGNNRNDARQENQQKSNMNQDDRKNKNNRRDRRDRNKRTDDSISDGKFLTSKEKTNLKRPHSSSPNRKDSKKRKEDAPSSETSTAEKPSTKKSKDDVKTETKTSGNQSRRGKATDDDNFSDWSDGDDDLLNRDDFIESESNSGDRVISKTDENIKKEKPSKSAEAKEPERKPKKDTSKVTRLKKKTDVRTRTASKERHDTRDFERLLNYSRKSVDLGDRNRTQAKSNNKSTEPSSLKSSNKPAPTAKDNKDKDNVATVESAPPKKEEMTVDDFVNNENDEYDPISDEELEALIEEPDDSLIKSDKDEEMKIVNALEINWSTLMSDTKTERPPSKARNRFKAAHVLSRIGFSQTLAGSALTEKIISFCQKQLQEEKEENESQGILSSNNSDKNFVMEHPIASFHVALMQKKKERQEIFNYGSYRQALSARQDLHIRKLLCRPSSNLVIPNTATSSYVQNQHAIETEPLKVAEVKETPSPILNAAC